MSSLAPLSTELVALTIRTLYMKDNSRTIAGGAMAEPFSKTAVIMLDILRMIGSMDAENHIGSAKRPRRKSLKRAFGKMIN